MNNQLMGDLPENRVTQTYLFLNKGVDYAGAFLIRDRRARDCKTYAYLSALRQRQFIWNVSLI